MGQKRSHGGGRSRNCPEDSPLSFGSPQQPTGFLQNGAPQQHLGRNRPSSDLLVMMAGKGSPVPQKSSGCIAEVVLKRVWLESRSSLTTGATKAWNRLLLPRSTPRPTLWALTTAAPPAWPAPGRGRGGRGENGGCHGASRSLHVRGARHYGSGVVESEDQHEREMENKEQ